MTSTKQSKTGLDHIVTLRVDGDTLTKWRTQAKTEGVSLGELIRERMSLGSPRRLVRRREPPAADPKLLAAVGRIGGNVNQIARAANQQQWPDKLALLERLISIERALDNLVVHYDD